MSALNSLTQASIFGVWTIQSDPKVLQSNPSKELMKFYFQESGEYMQGICRFEPSYGYIMPLFKSLVRLGTKSWLEVNYSSQEKSFYFLFPKNKVKEVDKLLNSIHLLLDKELQFKSSLNQLISNKKRFLAEQALLASSMGIKA
jgi:hypothetical protein